MTSYFQHGGHDVISCIKVLPPGEWKRSIFYSPEQQRIPVPDL